MTDLNKKVKVVDQKASVRKASEPKSRTLMYVQKTSFLGTRFADRNALCKHLDAYFADAEWAFILHDKDVEDGNAIDPHIHIAFLFTTPRHPSSIAKQMGEPPGADGKVSSQSVQIFKGGSAKSSMFSYLIHATPTAIAEGKYRYPVAEVTANFDYAGLVDRATLTAKSKTLDIEDIQAKIINGNLIMKSFFTDSSLGTKEEMALFYTRNKSKIDTAIDARYKLMMKSEEVNELEVIYIQGESGSGKTTIAKNYAERKYGDYFISGSSNDTVQDYMGEPVAIFDDARPSDLTASDWLKMLDPFNNKSSVASRYYNKYLAVKCIILTTTTPFQEFFVYTKGKGGGDVKEPVDQFMRRFNAVIKVHAETNQNGDTLAVGSVFSVAKTTPYQVVGIHDHQGRPVTVSHKLEPIVGRIEVKTAASRNTEKAQDLLRFFGNA